MATLLKKLAQFVLLRGMLTKITLEQTRGKYIELDLIVPEFVKDTDIWKRQPWYSVFKKAREPSKTKLYQFAPHSFALVFAATTNAQQSLKTQP